MNTYCIIANKVIHLNKRSKTYCLDMVDIFRAAGQLNDTEYAELLAQINEVYGE